MATTNSGSFKKGEKRPGQGRPKGVTNKATQELREMILQALDQAGGVQYLLDQAHANPNSFMGLIGKVLPLTLKAQVNGSLEITHIQRTIVDPTK